ncbi:hypothetical protein B0H14DRAFT_3740613, partial [Mycena olivaceomarginata]
RPRTGTSVLGSCLHGPLVCISGSISFNEIFSDISPFLSDFCFQTRISSIAGRSTMSSAIPHVVAFLTRPLLSSGAFAPTAVSSTRPSRLCVPCATYLPWTRMTPTPTRTTATLRLFEFTSYSTDSLTLASAGSAPRSTATIKSKSSPKATTLPEPHSAPFTLSQAKAAPRPAPAVPTPRATKTETKPSAPRAAPAPIVRLDLEKLDTTAYLYAGARRS